MHHLFKISILLCFFGLSTVSFSKDKFNFEKTLQSAEQGRSEAQNNLGKYYLKIDEEKAFSWFKSAAELGNRKAQFNLALCYRNGTGTEKNAEKAFQLFQELAQSGDADAMLFLGCCYRDGTGAGQDYAKAFELFQKADELGNTDANNHLGWCYLYGKGTEKNEIQAFECFKKAATAGNIDAEHNLARCYRDGIGTKKDTAEAFACFKKAAEAGDIHAQGNLAWCYQSGLGTKKNEAKAFEWFERAAQSGDSNAVKNLALCYRDGRGVKQNQVKAFELFQKSAESGNREALYQVGLCYAKGLGVSLDKEKAREAFRQAAEQGNTYAMLQMACYFFGADDFETDSKRAMFYIEMAADQGMTYAQIKAAETYLSGICILRNARDHSTVVGTTEKDLDKSLKYAARASISKNRWYSIPGSLILFFGNLQRGNWQEALKVTVQQQSLTKFISIILFGSLLLEGALIFWLFYKVHAVPIESNGWKFSDIFYLLFLAIPLLIIASAMTFLPSSLFITSLFQTLVIEIICIIIFAFLLKKRGCDPFSSFAFKHISIRRFITWTLLGICIIYAVDAVYTWSCHLLGYKIEAQLVSKLVEKSGENMVLLFFIGSILTPVVEELVFRGIIYQTLKTKLKAWIAMIASAFIFAALHGELPAFIPIFLFGIFMAFVLEKTKSIYMPIALHCLNNLIAFIILFAST